MQTEIEERFGEFIPMERVIMTSDEADEAWWEQVAAYGWKRLNHEAQHTAERYTRWCADFLRSLPSLHISPMLIEPELLYVHQASSHYRLRGPIEWNWLCWNRPLDVLNAL